MSASAAAWLVVLVALVGANLPFLNERLFVLGPRRAPKAFGWRLLELAVVGGLTLLLGTTLESSLGQRAPQGWEFYAAWTCLMLTLASPGFVWRYLRRGASAAHE
jgi:Protein of unknown function (DUF2818)